MINDLKDYAAEPDESLLYAVRTLYQCFIEKCDVLEREEVYNEILEEVVSARASAAALLPFIQAEPHRRMASSAAREYVLSYPTDPDDPFEGVRRITDYIINGPVGNRGAVFAGLVLLGDRRINGVARSVRNVLTGSDIRQFSYTHLDHLNAATIEFCMEWLLRLNEPGMQEEFRLVASTLNIMIIHDQTGVVVDLEQNLGPYGFTRSPRILHTWDFEDYLRDILPVLEYIATRTVQPRVIRNVIEMWTGYIEQAKALREGTQQALQ